MSFTSEFSDANFMIDYLDMLCVRKLLIPNEESIDNQDRFVRDNYLYNIMVQIELSTINAVSAITGEFSTDGAILNELKGITKRSNIPIASVHLQLIHEDVQKNLLINKH